MHLNKIAIRHFLFKFEYYCLMRQVITASHYPTPQSWCAELLVRVGAGGQGGYKFSPLKTALKTFLAYV